jgi:hypothetical protein
MPYAMEIIVLYFIRSIYVMERIEMPYQTELTEKYAREICTWKYDDEYSVYNYPDWNEASRQKWEITDADKRKIKSEHQLNGYFRFLVHGQTVMVGLGLSPHFCGKGYGKQLMKLIFRNL